MLRIKQLIRRGKKNTHFFALRNDELISNMKAYALLVVLFAVILLIGRQELQTLKRLEKPKAPQCMLQCRIEGYWINGQYIKGGEVIK